MNMKVNLDHYNSYYFYYVIHTAMTLKLTDKATDGFITLIFVRFMKKSSSRLFSFLLKTSCLLMVTQMWLLKTAVYRN